MNEFHGRAAGSDSPGDHSQKPLVYREGDMESVLMSDCGSEGDGEKYDYRKLLKRHEWISKRIEILGKYPQCEVWPIQPKIRSAPQTLRVRPPPLGIHERRLHGCLRRQLPPGSGR
jgi:hypothetical protein